LRGEPFEVENAYKRATAFALRIHSRYVKKLEARLREEAEGVLVLNIPAREGVVGGEWAPTITSHAQTLLPKNWFTNCFAAVAGPAFTFCNYMREYGEIL
jgi:hypothetical protein